MSEDQTQQTITRDEAARIIGVSTEMIARYERQGLLENVGSSAAYGRRRFRLADVQAFKRPPRGPRRRY